MSGPRGAAVTVEVCVDAVDGALAAERGGAHRLELCAGLAVGGLTPGPGLAAEVLARVALPVVVLARPRRGDFLYSAGDFAALVRDVEAARDAGAAGVALGVLCADGRVDVARTAELAAAARPLAVTFHRAFDLTREPERALEDLLELGVERVLTSGGAPRAREGGAVLAALVERAAGRLEVIAGGGVRADHVAALVARTGVGAVHFSAARTRPSAMRHRNAGCALGSAAAPGEYELAEVDPEQVAAVRRALGP